MNISINPLRMLAAASPLAGLPDVPTSIGGVGVLRFTGDGTTDSIKVAGALTADEFIPGGALGGALSATGTLDGMMPFGAKARLELTTDMSPPSPALAGYLELVKSHAAAIDTMQSNVDAEMLDDPTAALAFLRSLKPDEFVFAAQTKGRTVLWRGTEAELPAGVADVVKGTDALFGTLA